LVRVKFYLCNKNKQLSRLQFSNRIYISYSCGSHQYNLDDLYFILIVQNTIIKQNYILEMSINFCQIRENIKIMRSSCRCHNLKRKQSKILKIKLICKFVVFHYVAHCTTLDEFFKVPCRICFSTSGSFPNV